MLNKENKRWTIKRAFDDTHEKFFDKKDLLEKVLPRINGDIKDVSQRSLDIDSEKTSDGTIHFSLTFIVLLSREIVDHYNILIYWSSEDPDTFFIDIYNKDLEKVDSIEIK